MIIFFLKLLKKMSVSAKKYYYIFLWIRKPMYIYITLGAASKEKKANYKLLMSNESC